MLHEKPSREVVFWLAFAVVLVLLRTSLIGISDPSEGRYAVIAREMAESGDWIVPRFFGVPHLEKPPLAYWSAAAGIRLFGPHEFGIRIGAALALLASALLTGGIARRLAGPRAGWVAAVGMAITPYPLAVGASCLTDPFMLLATTLFHHSILRRLEGGSDRAMHTAVLALGIGFLAKGHAILVFTVLPLLFARTGLFGELWRPARLALLGLLILPWLVAAQLRFPGFAAWHLHKLVDFLGPGVQHHRAPFYLYVPLLLFGTYPFPRHAWRGASVMPPARRRLLMAWVLVPFLLLTLVRSRSWTYILPAMPPLVVLGAAGLALRRSGTRALALILSGAGLLSGALFWASPHWAFVWIAATLGTGALFAFAAGRQSPQSLALGLAAIASLSLVGATLVHEATFKIYRGLAQRTREVAGPDRPVVLVTTTVFSLAFYMDRPITLVGGSTRLRQEASQWGKGPNYRPHADLAFLLRDRSSVLVVPRRVRDKLAPERAVRFEQRGMLLLAGDRGATSGTPAGR